MYARLSLEVQKPVIIAKAKIRIKVSVRNFDESRASIRENKRAGIFQDGDVRLFHLTAVSLQKYQYFFNYVRIRVLQVGSLL